ncbi:MAG TPA: alpha-L-rhamnosidase C-terminal domain-containing protein [Terriglobia bacterium]|nr:alpha-L-rhamnosidase C-terminal domain-containing protein [Terriglobia bacterium]
MSASRTRALIFVALFLSTFPSMSSSSGESNPAILHQHWTAQWIACPGSPHREFGVYYFRKEFSLSSKPEHFVIHVSADNHYQLFVNSTRVSTGPARGDLFHWRYETLDIASHLQTGHNTIAAIVWNFAELAPMAQMSHETGLIVQGDTAQEAEVNTNASWKVLESQAVRMIPIDRKTIPFYMVVGPGIRVDASRVPWGWQDVGFDDSSWKPAEMLVEGGPRGIQDSHSPWMLVPRTIPMMEQRLQRLASVRRSQGVEVPDAFLQGGSPVTVPANTTTTVLFDQSFETTAYPELVVSGGKGSVITLTYAEALWKGRDKGNRNDIQGKKMLGMQDQFLPDGGQQRMFRTLWWRTYRYLQLAIRTGDEPLTLDDLRGIFTAYPFTVEASFDSGDPTLQKMWEVGWRTARLCAHTTYMDCPYYERLQYGGDTRIQILISLYMTGDDRLAKNAIELLNESRIPEGITQSRYPSRLPQFIPPFSLFWIGMMHDLWWYHGDTAFLQQYLPGMRDVLGWFERRMGPSGLLGRLEWWNFVDWTPQFKDGVPPEEADGQSSILTLQFVAALQDAADLESSIGNKNFAEQDRAMAAKIARAVYDKCWDPARRLLADTPARQSFSQHASILGVLANAIPEQQQKGVMQKVLTDSTLAQCSYYFRFYLFRALKKVGLGNDYLNLLGPWRQMLDLGLTTWAEEPEPVRSDCHAWSAHPNFDFLNTVAGIGPAAPGFNKVLIQPHLGTLDHLSATVPVPQGSIVVKYDRHDDLLAADITLPQGTTGWLAWGGQKLELHAGEQHVQVSR